MKLHLPKLLTLALIGAMSIGGAYATTHTPNESITTGALTTDTAQRDGNYIITKDGADTVTVLGDVTKYASIYVRDGELKVGDGGTTSTSFMVRPYEGKAGSISVGGKKGAAVIFDGAKFIDGKDAFIAVGNADGSGSLTLTNGSTMTNGDCEVFSIGSTTNVSNTGYDKGYYAPAANGSTATFGRGDVTITNGSSLTVAKSFFMGEGSLTVEGGADSASKVQLGYEVGPGYEGQNFTTGWEKNSTSVIAIKGNASVAAFAENQYHFSYEDNSTTVLTVEGPKASFSTDAMLGSERETSVVVNIGRDAKNTNTSLSVSGGGKISLAGHQITMGKADAGNTVNITVADADSTLEMKAGDFALMDEGTTITNSGTIDVTTGDSFYIYDGTLENKEGAAFNAGEFYSYNSKYASKDAERVIKNAGTIDVDIFYVGATSVTNSGDIKAKSYLQIVDLAKVKHSGSIEGKLYMYEGAELTALDGSMMSEVVMWGGDLLINGNVKTGALTLSGGTVTFMEDSLITLADGANVEIDGASIVVKLSDAKLADLKAGGEYTLFDTNSSVNALEGATVTFLSTSGERLTSAVKQAGDGSLTLVPEPTTATLSLLALAALAARRRRK